MSKFIKIVVPWLIGLLFIVFLEIILRAFFVDPRSLANYGYNPGGLGDLLPNKDFVDANVQRLPYYVITNSQGLRNEEEIDFSEDNFRILTIGDSFTYCPYVNNQDTWQAVLERILRAEYPDRKFQVLNSGVAGYTITDELEYLQERGVKTKPNLVILGIYANDINDLRPEKRAIYSRSLQKKRAESWTINFKNLAKKTAIFTWVEKTKVTLLSKKIKEGNKKGKLESDRKDINIYLQNFEEFLKFCQKNNIKLLVVFFPEVSQLISENKILSGKIKTQTNIAFDNIDLMDYLDKDLISNLYLKPLNDHLSAYGYLEVSQHIANYLKKNNYISE